MKVLKDILYGVSINQLQGSTIKEVQSVYFDSRKVGPHSLFVATKGVQVNGHDYIETAIENGATVIVCEVLPSTTDVEVTYVVVPNSQEALGVMAANWFDHPSKKLSLIGVTGTNG